MRIFVPTGIFHPEPGGPASYLYRLLPELQAAGHVVTVVTYGEGGTAEYSYPVIRIPRTSAVAMRYRYWQAVRQEWEGHDLAYIHSLGLPLAKSVRPRIAKIVGDPAWERAMNKGWIAPYTDIDAFQVEQQSLRVELNKTLRAREAQQMDHIVVPSHYLKDMVIGWGVDEAKISVIHNAVRDAGITPDMEKQDARKELGLPNFPTIFVPARLTAWKGVDYIMRSMVRSGLHLLRMVVAGDGPMRAELEALRDKLDLSKQVTFAGHVPLNQMPLYYRAADYTVVYSGYEGLSQTLLESLRAGTPVIASYKGGNPEVVEHGVNGLLAPFADVDGLGAALAEAFTTPGKRDELAANAGHNMQRFEWQTLVKETVSLLESYQ